MELHFSIFMIILVQIYILQFLHTFWYVCSACLSCAMNHHRQQDFCWTVVFKNLKNMLGYLNASTLLHQSAL